MPLLTIASTVLFAFVVVTYASRLDRSEAGRQSAERVLRESAEFNTQIVASAQEGIVVVDEHRRCVLWNPFMERLTGVSAQEVVGKPLMQATSFGVLTELEAMERALAGQHVEDDVERPHPSGQFGLASGGPHARSRTATVASGARSSRSTTSPS